MHIALWLVIGVPIVGFLVGLVIGVVIGDSGCDEPAHRKLTPWYVSELETLRYRRAKLKGDRWLGAYGMQGDMGKIPRLEELIKVCKEGGMAVPAQVRKDLKEAKAELGTIDIRIHQLYAIGKLVDAGYASEGSKWGIEPSK